MGLPYPADDELTLTPDGKNMVTDNRYFTFL